MSLDDLQRQQQESTAVSQICERLNELVRTFRRDGGPKILEQASSDSSLKGLVVSAEINTVAQVGERVYDGYWSEMAPMKNEPNAPDALLGWTGNLDYPTYGIFYAPGTSAEVSIGFFGTCYIRGDRLEWGPYKIAFAYGSAKSLSLPIRVGPSGFFW